MKQQYLDHCKIIHDNIYECPRWKSTMDIIHPCISLIRLQSKQAEASLIGLDNDLNRNDPTKQD